MKQLLSDLHDVFRSLRRSPRFASAVVGTLALCIGANAAVFSICYAALWRPSPYFEPERVHRVESPPLALRITDGVPVFDVAPWLSEHASVEARSIYYGQGGANLGLEEGALRVTVSQVSAEFFGTLGAQPIRGRDFAPEDEGRRVALVSEKLAGLALGQAAPDVGAPLELNDQLYQVVGVMPESVEFPLGTDIWIPLPLTPEFFGTALAPEVVFRMRADVSVEAAQGVFRALDDESRVAAGREPTAERRITLVPLDAHMTREARLPLMLLLGAVGLILLIGCSNIAGLLLARAEARRDELAVREALGAGRWRVARLLLAEAGVLAGAGALGGILLAIWLVDAAVTWFPTGVLPTERVSLSLPALAYTALVAVVIGLLLGIGPAWRTGRRSRLLGNATRAGLTIDRQRGRAILTGVQVATAVVLVSGAALLYQTMTALHAVPLGYDVARVVSYDVRLPDARFGPDASRQYVLDALERLRSIPGVAIASAGSQIPLSPGSGGLFSAFPVGRPGTSLEEGVSASHVVVSPEYFRTLGIEVRRGRDFEEDDGRAGRAFILSVDLAGRLFGSADPIGQSVELLPGTPDAVVGNVVGVADDVRFTTPQQAPFPAIYEPILSRPTRQLAFAVLTDRDPAALLRPVARAAAGVDPGVPPFNVRLLRDGLSATAGARPAVLVTFSMFAALALLLAFLGLYGIIAQDVVQRRRELAIRVALGRPPHLAARGVALRGLGLGALGVGAGLVLALLSARSLDALLFEVEPTDPITFLGVGLFVLAVSTLASWVPASRTTRIDPMEALRHE